MADKNYLAEVKAGLSLRNIPFSARTEEVCMAAVTQNYRDLLYVPRQTFEMCVAAAKQNEYALMYADPEFRTGALLKAVKAEDADEYDDDAVFVPKENRRPGGDNTTYVTLYGKGKGEFLEGARNILRRVLENGLYKHNDEWLKYALWADDDENPYCMEMSLSADKTSFALSFFLDGKNISVAWESLIYEALYEGDENAASLQMSPSCLPELFLETLKENEYGNACSCSICGTDGLFELCLEGDYQDSSGTLYESIEYFNDLTYKKRALWLLEGKGDSEAIKKAEKELAEAQERYDSFGEAGA
jgi:hypothetical protein